MPPLEITRRTLLWPAVALLVLIVELAATIGDPFTPVAGWGPTRPVDPLAFAMVALGCAALALFDRLPLTVAMIATGSYVIFALRGHELGMFLPPMVTVFSLTLTAQARHRLAATFCVVTSLTAALVWVSHRAATITEPGVTLLAWVAFGSVLTVFFFAPLLIGEIVRTRTQLRQARTLADPTGA